MQKENYSQKINRDLRAKELKLEGYKVKRRSTGPCQLHPEYIKDWKHAFQTGFGNTDYLTLHPTIYIVEYEK